MTIDEMRDKLRGKLTVECSLYGDGEMARIHALTLALLDEHEATGKVKLTMPDGEIKDESEESAEVFFAHMEVLKLLGAL